MSIALLAGLALILFLQVLFHFIFNYPLDWSEKLIRYILIGLIYLFAVVMVKENKMLFTLFTDDMIGNISNFVSNIMSELYVAALLDKFWSVEKCQEEA